MKEELQSIMYCHQISGRLVKVSGHFEITCSIENSDKTRTELTMKLAQLLLMSGYSVEYGAQRLFVTYARFYGPKPMLPLG